MLGSHMHYFLLNGLVLFKNVSARNVLLLWKSLANEVPKEPQTSQDIVIGLGYTPELNDGKILRLKTPHA